MEEQVTQHFLQQVLDGLPMAVWVSDPHTHEVQSVNRAFRELLGLGQDEAVGATPPYPWWEVGVDELGREDRAGTDPVESLFRSKSGRLVPVEVRRLSILGAKDDVVAYMILATDRSERREFEQRLLQSGKLAAIGQLAAGVAHEINNPLFAILGLLEFLLKEAEPATKSHERLVLIQQTALEIKEIVRALLDFAREPSDVFTTVSIEEVAAQTVDLVRRTIGAKDVEFVERYPAEATFVSGSPNQLKQIFLNLLTNAQQAMPDGGTVFVDIVRDGEWITATVSDTGAGIPPDVLPRIFEPFYTSKRRGGGSGLGLSVSLGIAQMHGGDLYASSRPSEGATFTLRLPVANEGKQ